MEALPVPVLRRLQSVPVYWWLLGASLIAAVPRFYLAATQYIEYDGYWHVFIAMQDNWQQFHQEYASNFHPPLFYLLLKVAMLFGHTPLVYRAISLLTGIAAVFVTGKITERFSFNRYTPVVAALAYGVALPSIIISCEVRSYMLSVFFIVVSFYYLLDMLQEPGQTPRKSRVLFAASAIVAGYSHYGAFLYICACAIATVLFDVLRLQRKLWLRLAFDAGTFAAIAAALTYVYVTHGQPHAVVAEHLRDYYLPSSHQHLLEFLTRNTFHLLNSFSPFPIANGRPFFLASAGLITGGIWLAYSIHRLAKTENLAAAATVLTSALLLSLIVAGGVLGKYPYGGELRQQFFLFPFAILCGCILLDRIASAINAGLASALLVSAAAVTIASWSFAFAQYPKVRTELGTAQMNRFRKDFPAPAAIYVDQFNVINFFIHYHDWHWQFIGRSREVPAITMYRVNRGSESLLLLRDWSRWSPDLSEAALFVDLAKCIREQHLPSLTVFYARHPTTHVPVQQEPALAQRIVALAANESLCVRKLRVEGVRVYADLAQGHCETEIGSPGKCSQCDDTNWSFDYSGTWQRGEFDQASNATLTYTNDPGASVRFSFEGTELRYVYTKAFNRGLAAIFVDGKPKGVVDLYSPTLEWQAISTFGGLPPGPHTVEIRATGRRNPASTGSYIDIDALQSR